jgi:ankyrin repeat protein
MKFLTTVLSDDKLDVVSEKYKATPAIIAAEKNHAEILEMLLKSGADANKSNHDGYSPIHFAALNNSLSSLRILLTLGKIDVNQEALSNGTAACIAAHKGHSSILKILADAHADFSKTRPDKYAPIHLAAQANSISAMAIILDHDKKNIDQMTLRGTAACIASARNHIDILDQLIRAGADTNKGFNDFFPLLLATSYGNIKIVNLLLENKNLNIDQVSSHGLTSLHVAAQKNYLEIALALLKSGASLELKQAYNMTPLDLAKHFSHQEMVDVLVKEVHLRYKIHSENKKISSHDPRIFSQKWKRHYSSISTLSPVKHETKEMYSSSSQNKKSTNSRK